MGENVRCVEERTGPGIRSGSMKFSPLRNAEGCSVVPPGYRAYMKEGSVIVLRQVIGDELRRRRQDQGRTLRDVSGAAAVSLGYLSEVERGQKEASSELLAAICTALEVSLSDVLASVSTQVARAEAPVI